MPHTGFCAGGEKKKKRKKELRKSFGFRKVVLASPLPLYLVPSFLDAKNRDIYASRTL
jgi:hypothetical protein